MQKGKIQELIKDHWKYIYEVLLTCSLSDKRIQEIEEFYCLGFHDGWEGNKRHLLTKDQSLLFHYSSAFTHGKKHRLEIEEVIKT